MSAVATRAVGKKCWEQHEFVAHGHNVNCLALGSTSGIMVTGGDDRKVNMWMVGKPNVIASLSGHTSPVESVQFNPLEESVVAGSQSGTMKIWDVEAAKITRTLTGHKSSIKCTDFHPYGDYITSGSMDTNVKVWDIRRKGCIMTFKGHTDVVHHLRFSPDGRWIVSAGEDSLCKLWDISAGKQLSEVKHAGPVNTVEFHPKEFLMATGSSDRTVKFWDLEEISLVSSTEQESNPIRSVAFHPEGLCLFSGSNDSLKVYGWEPVRCYDSFSVGWGKVSDMVFTSDKLVAASFFQTNASIWMAEFRDIEDMVSDYEDEDEDEEPQVVQVSKSKKIVKEEKKISPQRKVFESKRPVTSSSKTRKPKVDQSNKTNTPVRSSPTDDYGSAFTPRSALERSPPPKPRYPSQSEEQPKTDKNPESREENVIIKPEKLPSKNNPEKIQKNIPEKVQKNNPEKVQKNNPEKVQKNNPEKIQKNNPEKVQKNIPEKVQKNIPEKVQKNVPEKNQKTVPEDGQKTVAEKAPKQSVQNKQSASSVPSNAGKKAQEKKVISSEEPDHIPTGKPSTLVPSERNKPAGLYMEDFLPDSDVSVAKKEVNLDRDIPSAPKITEAEAANVIQKGHTPFTAVITNRQRNLGMVWRQWKDGDIKGAVQTAINMNDQSTLVDFLSVLTLKQTLWTLDLCSVVLPNIKELLLSRYESYIQTGASVVKLVLRNFAPVIKSNMAAPAVSVGVDVVREERFQKCQTCHAHLMSVRDVVQTKLNVPGRSGSLYRELSLLFSSLD